MRFVRYFAAYAVTAAGLGSLLPVVAAARPAPLPRTAMAAHGSQPMVYAVNQFAFSVTAFQQTANGNVPPFTGIAGSRTKIYEPEGMAMATSGQIAVSESSNSVTLYAPGAHGNVAPSATITCGRGQQPGVPGQIAFDRHGNLYVKYYGGYHAPSDAIEVYAPKQQSGCPSDNHVLFGARTGISSDGGIAVDRNTIYTGAWTAVQEFHTSDNGNVAPYNVIAGSRTGLVETTGIALDKRGYLYVSNVSDVVVFAPGATGNASPSAVIAGSNTQIPSGYGALSIAVAKDGTIFVGVENAQQVSSILVFAAGSNGNVAPIRVISGQNTGIDWPAEMIVQ
ncbi:MAG: hypothetical protein JO043_04555 [Candidatus Eremiobacteraeota bacterium]|nr:hypothetical protein [Candidatus Eremiobacteraeota bacterium]